MKYILVFFISIYFSSIKSQSIVSLLVADKLDHNKILLMSYNFRNDNFIDIDTLFKYENLSSIYIKSQIYKNRYILPFFGSYFDLKQNLIYNIPDYLGNLLYVQGDSLIYYSDETDLYFTYKLGNEIIDTIKRRNKYYFEGELSPDKTKGLTYTYKTNEISLHQSQGSIILGNLFTYQNHKRSIASGYLPKLWLNNDFFLTQIRNGDLVKVDLKGNIEQVVKIKRIGKASDDIEIYKDINGDIIYKFTTSGLKFISKYYKIDVKNKTYEAYNPQSVYDKYGFKVRIKWTSKNRGEFRQTNLSILNTTTNKKIEIVKPYYCKIIGWIERE